MSTSAENISPKNPRKSVIRIRDVPPWVTRALTFLCAYALLGLSLFQGYDYAQVKTEPGVNRIMYTIGILAFILLAHLSVYMIVLANSTGNKRLSGIGWGLLAWGSLISIFTSTFMYNQQTFSAIAKQNQSDPIYQASMRLFNDRTDLADGLTGKVTGAPDTWQTQSRKTSDKAGHHLDKAEASLDRAAAVSSSTIDAADKAMLGMFGVSSAWWAFMRAAGQTVAEMLVTFYWTSILGMRRIDLVPVDSDEGKGKK